MKRRTRIRYTDAHKGLMRDRWQKGESLHQIAKLFDRHHMSVRRVFAATGGIRPAARLRSVPALTLAERKHVSRSLVAVIRSVRQQDIHFQAWLKAGRCGLSGGPQSGWRPGCIRTFGWRVKAKVRIDPWRPAPFPRTFKRPARRPTGIMNESWSTAPL